MRISGSGHNPQHQTPACSLSPWRDLLDSQNFPREEGNIPGLRSRSKSSFLSVFLMCAAFQGFSSSGQTPSQLINPVKYSVLLEKSPGTATSLKSRCCL